LVAANVGTNKKTKKLIIMDNNFVDEVKLKSSEELREIVVNFHMYRGALVAAAKGELANRGIELSDQEQRKIIEIKNKRQQEALQNSASKNAKSFFKGEWKRGIVKDLDAPELYSRRVIYTFSILFSVFCGGILLASNLKTVEKRKARIPVILFSIGYTLLIIFILNLIPGYNSGFTIVFNILGSVVLHNYFWNKYIGEDLHYRPKPIWKPLIICIIIFGFIIWTIIANK
jgi:uncharacterized membrane protein